MSKRYKIPEREPGEIELKNRGRRKPMISFPRHKPKKPDMSRTGMVGLFGGGEDV